jgi:catechol 2,3-dioxygenase-like lactoylglutathione lyase family enzyme
MIDHVSIEVGDLVQATVFYDAVLATLGLKRLTTRDTTVGYGKKYPEFWLNQREDAGAGPESGAHVALRCRSAGAVDEFHATALSLGGRCDGAPGPRPEYSDSYYAAFVRDPDGNRMEAVTFTGTGTQ